MCIKRYTVEYWDNEPAANEDNWQIEHDTNNLDEAYLYARDVAELGYPITIVRIYDRAIEDYLPF